MEDAVANGGYHDVEPGVNSAVPNLPKAPLTSGVVDPNIVFYKIEMQQI